MQEMHKRRASWKYARAKGQFTHSALSNIREPENAGQYGCPKQSDGYENRISRTDQEKGRNCGRFP